MAGNSYRSDKSRPPRSSGESVYDGSGLVTYNSPLRKTVDSPPLRRRGVDGDSSSSLRSRDTRYGGSHHRDEDFMSLPVMDTGYSSGRSYGDTPPRSYTHRTGSPGSRSGGRSSSAYGSPGRSDMDVTSDRSSSYRRKGSHEYDSPVYEARSSEGHFPRTGAHGDYTPDLTGYRSRPPKVIPLPYSDKAEIAERSYGDHGSGSDYDVRSLGRNARLNQYDRSGYSYDPSCPYKADISPLARSRTSGEYAGSSGSLRKDLPVDYGQVPTAVLGRKGTDYAARSDSSSSGYRSRDYSPPLLESSHSGKYHSPSQTPVPAMTPPGGYVRQYHRGGEPIVTGSPQPPSYDSIDSQGVPLSRSSSVDSSVAPPITPMPIPADGVIPPPPSYARRNLDGISISRGTSVVSDCDSVDGASLGSAGGASAYSESGYGSRIGTPYDRQESYDQKSLDRESLKSDRYQPNYHPHCAAPYEQEENKDSTDRGSSRPKYRPQSAAPDEQENRDSIDSGSSRTSYRPKSAATYEQEDRESKDRGSSRQSYRPKGGATYEQKDRESEDRGSSRQSYRPKSAATYDEEDEPRIRIEIRQGKHDRSTPRDRLYDILEDLDVGGDWSRGGHLRKLINRHSDILSDSHLKSFFDDDDWDPFGRRLKKYTDRRHFSDETADRNKKCAEEQRRNDGDLQNYDGGSERGNSNLFDKYRFKFGNYGDESDGSGEKENVIKVDNFDDLIDKYREMKWKKNVPSSRGAYRKSSGGAASERQVPEDRDSDKVCDCDCSVDICLVHQKRTRPHPDSL